jgi:hypothetical protein
MPKRKKTIEWLPGPPRIGAGWIDVATTIPKHSVGLNLGIKLVTDKGEMTLEEYAKQQAQTFDASIVEPHRFIVGKSYKQIIQKIAPDAEPDSATFPFGWRGGNK